MLHSNTAEAANCLRLVPGTSEATAPAGEEKGVDAAPQQQTVTAGKKKKKSRRSSRGAKATEGDLRQSLPGHQRPSTTKKKGI